MLVVGIIAGFLILMALVVVHEFGHYIMARKSGVVVGEFGIGIPPRAKGWKLKSGMIFSLNWIPIGGFCKMKGENASDKRKGTFGAASFWSKTKILMGGVLFNLIASVVIFSVLAVVGMPIFMQNQFQMSSGRVESDNVLVVVDVQDGSPAYEAGISERDEIVWLGSACNLVNPLELPLSGWTALHAGQTVEIGVLPEGYEEVQAVMVTLNPEGSDYFLGVSSTVGGSVAPLYFARWWQAPIVGVVTTAQLTGETIVGVGDLLWNLVSGVFRQVSFDDEVREAGRQDIGQAGDMVSGPVGIVGVLFPAFTSAGPRSLMFLAGVISLSLAVMNLLPIPALDGGRWLLIAVYKLRKKPLTAEAEAKIVGTSFMVMLGLFVVITLLDVMRFF